MLVPFQFWALYSRINVAARAATGISERLNRLTTVSERAYDWVRSMACSLYGKEKSRLDDSRERRAGGVSKRSLGRGSSTNCRSTWFEAGLLPYGGVQAIISRRSRRVQQMWVYLGATS